MEEVTASLIAIQTQTKKPLLVIAEEFDELCPECGTFKSGRREIGDGALPSLFPPEFATQAVEPIKRGATRAGRDIHEIDVSGCVWFCLSDGTDASEDSLRHFAYYGPHLAPAMTREIGLGPMDFDPIKSAMTKGDIEEAKALVTDRMMRLAISGSPEDCVTRLQELEGIGITQINIGPPLGSDPEESIETIGKKIIPNFR